MVSTARLVTLVSALATVLCGCASTGSASGCRNVPVIPKPGTEGAVQVSPLPDIGGYRVRFKDRDWQVVRTAVNPTPFVARAVVVSASPFPELRVTPSEGPAITLALLDMGCA